MSRNMILSLALVAGLFTSPVMADGSKLGFEGTWAKEKALCNRAKNVTGEGVVTITSTKYNEYESSCKIKKLGVPRNSVYRIVLSCDSEGESMGDSVLWMNTENPNKALTSWGVEGKEMGELVRCK